MPKKYLEQGNMFTETPEEAANRAWGGLDEQEKSALGRGRRERIEQIDIDRIVPDWSQPRRVFPSAVRGAAGEYGVGVLLAQWRQITRFGVEAILEGGELNLPKAFTELNPAEEGFINLARLAASIRRDGLANPITVYQVAESEGDPAPDWWFIETGERRWLAYHLLAGYFADEDWSRIPARVVEAHDVWRQAAENTARSNLNAVGRARQFALLLLALYPERPFRRYEECESDRAFYAQALELTMPYGEGGRLLSAMGVNSRERLTVYRRTLELSDDVWNRADDGNWPEAKLFGTPNNANERSEQRGVAKEFASWLESRRKNYAVFAKRAEAGSQAERALMAAAIQDEIEVLVELQKVLQR
jgi:hypothetical protein